MKYSVFFLVGVLYLTLPAFSELSESDLQRIREIVKVEVNESEKRIRAEIKTSIDESEKRMKEYIDTKLEGFDDRVNLISAFLVAIMALIVVAIGLPQVIIAIKQRNQEELRVEIKQLREEIELLKQEASPHPEST